MHIQTCLLPERSPQPARSGAPAVLGRGSLILFLAFLVAPCRPAAAETAAGEKLDVLLAMNLEQLVEVEVVSASRRPQKLNEAPAPIYVFTAEDIQRTGVRNIMELVKFIPGFYVYPRIDQTFVIVTRGLYGFDKILFLVDGIPLNNIAQGGAVNAHIFPGLDMVKRVEVIPGPGSTMWGSDASLGIVSIITKDGKDVDGTAVSADVATVDNHRQVNLLSGKEYDWGEYMFSATYAENDGFGDERYGFQNYVQDFGSIPWNDDRANFNHIYPSYEIYGKFSYNNFTLKALASEKSIYSFWNTSQSTHYRDMQDKKSIHTSQDLHVELGHHAALSRRMTLETKLSAKKIDYARDEVVETGTNHGSDFISDPDDPDDVFKPPIHDRTEIFPEQGVGLEFLFNWEVNDRNRLLAGASMRLVEAGPGEFRRFNINTGEPPPVKPAREVLYEETTDGSYGVYVEDAFSATDNLSFIGGVRIDYNDPRETVAVIMPRGAAIYRLSDAWSAKYMYNTGYVRPQMGKSFAVATSKAGSVKESEKSRAHDLALIYRTEKTQLVVDAFHMTIYDLYSYDAFADAHVNTGDIYSRGVELLFKRSFWEGKVVFDLNYGYSDVEKEDRFGNESTYYHGIPKHVYTAGLTYFFAEQISLHANVNGWADLEMNNAPATAWYSTPAHPDSYSGDYLVDMNLRVAELFQDHLDLSLYVLNVFDREARLQALDDWHSWWSYARDRSVGIKATWKF